MKHAPLTLRHAMVCQAQPAAGLLMAHMPIRGATVPIPAKNHAIRARFIVQSCRRAIATTMVTASSTERRECLAEQYARIFETGKKEDGVILGIIAVRSGRKPLRGPCVLAGQHNMLSHKMSFLGDTRYSEQWQEEFF